MAATLDPLTTSKAALESLTASETRVDHQEMLEPLTDPKEMLEDHERKAVLIGTVRSATGQIDVRRRYEYDDWAQLGNHKVSWAVGNADGVQNVEIRVAIWKLARWAGAKPIGSAYLPDDSLLISYGCDDHSFIKRDGISAAWGDHRIAQILIADMQRVAAFMGRLGICQKTGRSSDQRDATSL